MLINKNEPLFVSLSYNMIRRINNKYGTKQNICFIQKYTQSKVITYVSGIANRAHVTTVASKIFQPSLQYDPGCKIKPKSTI